MSAQYDAIASDYKRTKESPLRSHIEAYSFFNVLGDQQGNSIVDLACGEGFYTRKLRLAGAARVTGVDISAEMIALAQAEEQREALGVDYLCADVASLELDECFDLVTAAYLLHYATSTTQLDEMCRRVATLLQPGGRFVCINENPLQAAEDYAGYAQYGFNKSVQLPRTDGSAIEYTMLAGRNLIRFEAFYYSQSCYEAALQAAGFSNIRWRGLELDPAGVQLYGEDYFREYLENPPIVLLECTL